MSKSVSVNVSVLGFACDGVYAAVCVCGLTVVSSTFAVLERGLHSLFQVKKGRARHDQ